MISNESISRLSKLLLEISQEESHLEDIREVLFYSEGFDLQPAFEMLDYLEKQFITSDDIFKFMQSDLSFTPMTCYLILKEWDFQNIGHLDFRSFSKLLLPANCQPHPPNSFPTDKTEFAVKKILKSELSYIKKIENLKTKLFKSKNFSPAGCFNLIDVSGQGFLTAESLSSFIQKFHEIDKKKIEALLRRIDRNQDGIINYTEFIQVVTPANSVYGSEENFKSVFSYSNTESPKTKKTKPEKTQKKLKKKQSGVHSFARFLMQQITLEKELEEKRMELALRADFTIGKLFALIDRTGKGKIQIKQLEEGLSYLGIVPELNQSYLLFRHYDRDNDNHLDFWDFYEIFNPRNKVYSDLVISRVSSKELKEKFSNETLDLITDTFIVLLNIQTVTEELKQKMFKKGLDLQKVFEKIDINRLGFLTRGCFRNLLRQFKYYATDRDLEGILLVYDSNKEGKISYSKFVQGVCPRQ